MYGVLAHLLNLLSGSRHSNLTRDALCALSNPSVRGVDPSRRLPWLPLETRRAAGGCVGSALNRATPSCGTLRSRDS